MQSLDGGLGESYYGGTVMPSARVFLCNIYYICWWYNLPFEYMKREEIERSYFIRRSRLEDTSSYIGDRYNDLKVLRYVFRSLLEVRF